MTTFVAAPSPATAVGPAADKATWVATAQPGDFFFEDDTGLLYRKSVAGAAIVVAPGAATITAIVPGVGATNLGKAEDAAHTSGDVGVMALAVQKATPADIGSEGDYEPLQVSGGRQWVSAILEAGAQIIGKVGLDPATAAVGYGVKTTITRPANATPYTAMDVIGGALDLGVLGPSGKEVMFLTLQLEYDVAALPAGMTNCLLALYNVTPPSAIADNGAWDLPAGDRASFLGLIDLGTLVDRGSTLIIEVSGVNKVATLSGTHAFAYLVTVGGFTPAGNSEVLALTAHTVPV